MLQNLPYLIERIEVHTCNEHSAYTDDKVTLKIENSNSESCNTNQVSNGDNFGPSILNNCSDFAINGDITMTVSKSGTNFWAFCWAKVYVNNSEGCYHCKNPKSENDPWISDYDSIEIQCIGPPSE